MNTRSTGLTIILALLALTPCASQEKIAASERAASTPEEQIRTLQKQVQLLQAQVAALQSVLKIEPDGSVTLQSQAAVRIQAGTTLTARSSAAAVIESSAALNLKGPMIKFNGGSRPVAVVGSQVDIRNQPVGTIMTGSTTVYGD